MMTSFVLVHGAWHGGWCWERVVPLLEAEGHFVTAPTLTGLAERVSVLSRDVNLTTHINDIVDHIRAANLDDVTLVGHSYGGFPASAAALQIPDVVSHLVLLDAFLPDDGEMLLDHAPAFIEEYGAQAAAEESWNIPPLPAALFGVGEPDQSWVDAQLTPQPVNTYFERTRFESSFDIQRKSYIRCTQAPGDQLERSLSRVRRDSGWRYIEIDAAHDVMISDPELLAYVLLKQL